MPTEVKGGVSLARALREYTPDLAKKTKKELTTLKLLGADYKTTCSSINEKNVHYLVLLYSVIGDIYTINNIYFIDREYVNESCIIPRNALKPTAKRAGWQGCTLVFNTFKLLKI